MAKGISEALVLTFEGVGLSVPSIYFFALFRNRVSIDIRDLADAGRRVPAALCPGRPEQAGGRRQAPPAPRPNRRRVIANVRICIK